MTDWIILLMLAISGIIGYLLMGLIDRSIDRHTAGSEKTTWEKRENEHAETGEPENACPRMPVLLHVER